MNAAVAWDIFGTRAMRAYFRSGGTEQPSTRISGAEEVDGKNYIILRNVRGLMAVYRVTNNDTLRRLSRWPKDIA